MVRSSISFTYLPLSFGSCALEIATYTLNYVSSKYVDKASYKLWIGHKPNLDYLRICDWEAYVKKLTLNKLSSEFEKCLCKGLEGN